MKTVYLRFKDDLRSEGMTLSDFSSLTPFMVSTLELGLPTDVISSWTGLSRNLTSIY